jgi:hypothetical protein
VTPQARRWRRLAAFAAAGAFALPFAAGAQGDGEEPEASPAAVAWDDVVQDAIALISIDQWSSANSGANEQYNAPDQLNDTVQDADATADGGEATATASPVEGAEAPEPVVADALGGSGGTADAANDAMSGNNTAGNAMTTGSASASNGAGVSVSQTQDNTSTNTATSDSSGGGAAVAAADSGGSGGGAAATSSVQQTAAAEVVVVQTAESNSGGNVQVNEPVQTNVTDQSASGSANGGTATADASGGDSVATGGDGGAATATNSATSTNTSGGNTMTTGNSSSSNSSTVTVTQSNSNSSTNTATVTSGSESGG